MDDRAARLLAVEPTHQTVINPHSATPERPATEQEKVYVLDTNVLIHDPKSLLSFEEHRVVIPMTVLEELDHLKTGKSNISADCRQAIRQIDGVLGGSTPEEVEQGVPIPRKARRQLQLPGQVIAGAHALQLITQHGGQFAVQRLGLSRQVHV